MQKLIAIQVAKHGCDGIPAHLLEPYRDSLLPEWETMVAIWLLHILAELNLVLVSIVGPLQCYYPFPLVS